MGHGGGDRTIGPIDSPPLGCLAGKTPRPKIFDPTSSEAAFLKFEKCRPEVADISDVAVD